MKKIAITAVVALMACACQIESSSTSNRTSTQLDNFAEDLLLNSIKSPVFELVSLERAAIFKDNFKDTLYTDYGTCRIVIEKTPSVDSTWTVKAIESECYDFKSVLRMLSEGFYDYNKFKVTTSGTYNEEPYSARFETDGDFFIEWVKYSENYSLKIGYQAVSKGNFKVTTYLNGKTLDEMTNKY